MKRISTRFALMMAAAAVVPLLAYGAVSIVSVSGGVEQVVIQGNQDIARRVGEQIERYVIDNVRILNAVAADIQHADLAQWQQDQILTNFARQFAEFKELTLLDENGRAIASSRVDLPDPPLPGADSLPIENALISKFSIDDDLLPTAIAAIKLQDTGWLVGQLRLEALWRMVDNIQVGSTGYALVVTDEDLLLAHGGNAQSKSAIARREKLNRNRVIMALRAAGADIKVPVYAQYQASGQEVLGVGAKLSKLGWMVIVEQPTREAFAISASLQRLLVVSIAVALFAMLVVGSLWGRRFIQPILRLTRGTRELAAGQLDTRVAVETGDEMDSSEPPSTPWRTGWSSCKRTCARKSATPCSAALRSASSTTSRTRFRTWATAASSC